MRWPPPTCTSHPRPRTPSEIGMREVRGWGVFYYPILCTILDVLVPTSVPILWSLSPQKLRHLCKCTPLAWWCTFLSVLNPPSSLAQQWKLCFPCKLHPLSSISLSLVSLSFSSIFFITSPIYLTLTLSYLSLLTLSSLFFLLKISLSLYSLIHLHCWK